MKQRPSVARSIIALVPQDSVRELAALAVQTERDSMGSAREDSIMSIGGISQVGKLKDRTLDSRRNSTSHLVTGKVLSLQREDNDDVSMENRSPRNSTEESEGGALEYKKCLKEYLCAQVSFLPSTVGSEFSETHDELL